MQLLKKRFAVVVSLALFAPALAGAQAPNGVLVAPFVNISGGAADDWIGAGIAETVLADFQQVAMIAVLRPEAAGPIAAGDVSDAALAEGRRAGAAWLVTGGYQRLGEAMRITARLVNTATGEVAAGIKVDGVAADLFALQDQLAVELNDALSDAVGQSRLADGSSPGLRPPASEGFGTDGLTAAESGNGNGVSPNRPRADGVILPERRDRPGNLARRPPAALGRGAETAGAPAPPIGVEGEIVLGDGPRSAGFGVAEGAGILTGRPTIRPPRAAEPPRIDGQLDDAIWRDAVHITEFVQQNPVEGAPATEATDVWIAYDNQNVYFAFHAHYSDPGMMRANRVDRDQSSRDDNVSVYFDTFVDQQRAFRFSVNGYGVQGDGIVNARGGGGGGGRGRRGGGGPGRGRGGVPSGDSSWDTLFDSGGQIVDDGFTAEMAIPFKSLRYPQRDRDIPHRWGFQVVREVRSKDEYQVWAPMTRNVAGFLTQMGILEGMTNLSLSRNLEFFPTFTAVQHGSLDGAAYSTRDPQPEGGLSLKYGITSNLVADATFNPDFSQIETDLPQIEVNQRFALRYPELRPFFLEGAEIFQVSGPITFLHTRTIVDPEFGGKVTGKVGNMTIGVLVANDEQPGRVEEGNPAFGQKANNFAGRVRYDLYAESYIGVLFTHRAFMGSHSTFGGVDANFRLGQIQSISVKAMQTDHVDLELVNRPGHLYEMNWRLNGRHLNAFVAGYGLSPDFRHDLGFVRRPDQQRVSSNVSYTFRPEGTVVSWGPSLSMGFNRNYEHVREDDSVRAGFRMTFARNISFSVDFQDEMERYRGINFNKRGVSIGGQINTSRRFSIGGYYRRGDEVKYPEEKGAIPYLGYGSSGRIFATVRPFSRFQSEINLSTSDFIDTRTGDILIFDVKILRALSTYQFSDRFLLRNIAEYNNHDRTLGLNMLLTYRVNAGTAFYIGYDDHYQQADLIYDDLDGDGYGDQVFPTVRSLQRTNRAFFTKFQYLFRY